MLMYMTNALSLCVKALWGLNFKKEKERERDDMNTNMMV